MSTDYRAMCARMADELDHCRRLLWDDHRETQMIALATEARAALRPKPPSDKELALLALAHLDKGAQPQMDTTEAVCIIRRALEALDD
jgi:hypothetical protein